MVSKIHATIIADVILHGLICATRDEIDSPSKRSARETAVAMSGHKPEKIFAKPRQVDVWMLQDPSVADAMLPMGESEAAYDRRRRKFANLKAFRKSG
jgi:hypothetical protein